MCIFHSFLLVLLTGTTWWYFNEKYETVVIVLTILRYYEIYCYYFYLLIYFCGIISLTSPLSWVCIFLLFWFFGFSLCVWCEALWLDCVVCNVLFNVSWAWFSPLSASSPCRTNVFVLNKYSELQERGLGHVLCWIPRLFWDIRHINVNINSLL